MVIGGPLFSITQHFVRFVNFFEPGFGLGVALVNVGVVFAGQFAVGGFYFFFGGVFINAQNFIIILVFHIESLQPVPQFGE